MVWVDQRIAPEPGGGRADGRDEHGVMGDCLRAAVASLCGLPYEQVPHFLQHVSWWEFLRHWARERGFDFVCQYPRGGSIRWALAGGDIPDGCTGLFIGLGPSARFEGMRHAVLVDEDLVLVHDPHPARLGLGGPVDEVLIATAPYWPPPTRLALPAGSASPATA